MELPYIILDRPYPIVENLNLTFVKSFLIVNLRTLTGTMHPVLGAWFYLVFKSIYMKGMCFSAESMGRLDSEHQHPTLKKDVIKFPISLFLTHYLENFRQTTKDYDVWF